MPWPPTAKPGVQANRAPGPTDQGARRTDELARRLARLEQPNHPTLAPFVVADLPDPADNLYALILVTDESGGTVPAFSDGTNWRRFTDRAIVS